MKNIIVECFINAAKIGFTPKDLAVMGKSQLEARIQAEKVSHETHWAKMELEAAKIGIDKYEYRRMSRRERKANKGVR